MSVVLLRGINVGGKNKLAMADLRRLISDLGGGTTRTYIQSGNAVCEYPIDAEALASAIDSAAGFRPEVVVLEDDDFRAAAARCPFVAEAEVDGRSVHVYFAAGPLTFDIKSARSIATDTERVEAGSSSVYLYAPDGVARSKLSSSIERFADRTLTARNANTVAKLLSMLDP